MKQFDPRDEFLIIEVTTRKPIETQPTAARAERAVQNLHEHEQLNGRDTRYTYIKNDERP